MRVVLAVTALLLLVTGCGTNAAVSLPPAGDHTLRIVSSLPSKGIAAEQTRLMREAVDLAIQDNRATLPTWKIEHIALEGGDSETGDWSAAKEAENARAALADPSVIAYLGPYNSGAAMVSMPILNQGGLLQLLPSATWPGLSEQGYAAGEPGRYMPTGRVTTLRLMPPDDVEARLAAQLAVEAGAKNALTLNDGSDYSRGMVAAFTEEASALGLEKVQLAAVTSLDTPATTDLADADVIFAAPSSIQEAEKMAQALAGKPPKLGVYVTDVAMSSDLQGRGRQLAEQEGWRFLFNDDPAITQNAAYKQFATEFRRTYGQEPTRFAANSYDLVSIVLPAAQKAGRDRQALIASALQTKDADGVTGPMAFSADGDIIGRTASVYRLQNGKFVQEQVP